ncbi:MAG TPA: HEAT repeat domain-containing protein, partial [Longimicrobium sp.]
DSSNAIRARVRAIPGVAEVDVAQVCCGEDGGTMLYVGIREEATPPTAHRPTPTGAARLPAGIVAAGAAFESALMSAVRRDVAGEDHSRGYSLAHDSAMRAVQERFIGFAARRLPLLDSVLRTSADAEHRALAAQAIAYGADRKAVAAALLHAVNDPDDGVRNNAVRALAILAGWAREHPEAGVVIPSAPFLRLVDSVSWSDRNKGVFALVALTATRDSALLAELRARSLPSLVKMARWTSPGHAMFPFLILARIAGMTDQAASEAWQAGEREAVIARASAQQ